MKKFSLITLATLSALFAAAPAARAVSRADCVRQVENCEAIIREFMADENYAIPAQVLQAARGIVITSQLEAGFVFGMKGGHGVIMVRRADGAWSIPVLIRAGGASVGFQAGGKTAETVFIITDEATPKALFTKRFNVGVDAKAVAGPKFAEAETVNKEILEIPVLVYVRNKGLMAGATVKAGYMSRHDDANRRLYETSYTMPELLYGNFVPPPAEVQPLMAFVKQITAAGAPAAR